MGGGIAIHDVVAAKALAIVSCAYHVHGNATVSSCLQIEVAAASGGRQKQRGGLGHINNAGARPSKTAFIARSRRVRASEIRAEKGGIGEQDWGVIWLW